MIALRKMPSSLPQASTGMSLELDTNEGDLLAGMRAGQGGTGVTQKGSGCSDGTQLCEEPVPG